MAMRDWKNAIKAIGVLANTGDRIEDFYSQLAELNIKHENFLAAYVFFGRLIENEPDNPNWYLQQANVAIELDSLVPALRILDVGLDRFGDLEELLLNKSMYLTASREYGQAEDILRALITRDSSNVGYRNNLANVLMAQDVKHKKEEAYLILKAIQPLVTDSRLPIDSTIEALKEELDL
jgi:tetratricopeptide (TPR) repeat protein